MFTGIIVAVGKITGIEQTGTDQRLCIQCGMNADTIPGIGGSIAVNGVCLTVVSRQGDTIEVDVSGETLACTAFGGYASGDTVNLEPALSLSDRLDGHIVTGHVDDTGTVVDIAEDGRSKRMLFECPDRLMRYIVMKGSVCIDGTSLTVNAVERNRFSVNVIPHTLEQTIMSTYENGTAVNIEVDLLARYIENMLPGNKD